MPRAKQQTLRQVPTVASHVLPKCYTICHTSEQPPHSPIFPRVCGLPVCSSTGQRPSEGRSGVPSNSRFPGHGIMRSQTTDSSSAFAE